MTEVSFVVPFRAENEYRLESFGHVLCGLQYAWPAARAEIWVSDNPGEFNRSAARNQGAMATAGEVLVFVDADSEVPYDQMQRAVSRVGGFGGWAFPYDSYCSLTQTGSRKKMTRETLDPTDYAYVFPSPETPEPSVGGCVVVSREAFDIVGGYDERFIGWGEEDRAFAIALSTLVGPAFVEPGPLYHLWHPAPEEVRFDQPNFMGNRRLCNRYREASGNPVAMKSLVDEHR